MTDDQPAVLNPLSEFLELLGALRNQLTPDERRRAADLVCSLVRDAVEGGE